jgi:hypothetical protein
MARLACRCSTRLACVLALWACNDRDIVDIWLSPPDTSPPKDAGVDAALEPAAEPSYFDSLFARMLGDLEALDPDRRPFTRYVSLGHRVVAGASPAELELERSALALLTNSVSTRPELAPPVPIDGARTLYRVDLRDYGWDREIPIGDVRYESGWEVLAAADRYAVEFVGPEADALRRLTGAAIPYIHGGSFLDVASKGEVYAALTNVPSTLEAAFSGWGLAFEARIGGGGGVRAATTGGTHLDDNDDLMMERYDIDPNGGALWLSSGSYANGGKSIYDTPFDIDTRDTFGMFSLPNGLLGFALFDATAARTVSLEHFPALESGISCLGCHTHGPLRVVDTVRRVALVSQADFDTQTFDSVLSDYLPQAQLDELFTQGQEAYRTRSMSLGVPGALGAQVISASLAAFAAPVTLAEAASELGVSADVLAASSIGLAPEFATLASDLPIPRSDFSRAFALALCALHADSPRNRPAAERCAKP